MKTLYEAILVLMALFYEMMPIFPFYNAASYATPSGIANFYDALYLALGIRENCQVVTADEKLVNAVGTAFPNLIWLPTWP